jgi:hypothetical protein
MDSFCDVFLKKRFIKCISRKDDTCYLFTGRVPSIKSIITKIKKNKKNDENDNFENVTDDEIQKLFDYLGLMKKGETTDTDDQRKVIKETMFLDQYSSDKLIFVNESIDEDDTNEIIIRKIIYNCYKDKTLTAPYLYAWYVDGVTNRNTPVQFKYEDESTEYLDFYRRIPKECIDSSLIDSNGDRNPKQTNNKNITLYEKSINPSDVIYFVSLEEYLEETKMFEEIVKYTEEEIKTKKGIKSFINGLVFKYWPYLSYPDILLYRSESSIIVRKALYEKQKTIHDIYSTGMYIIESEFLGNDVNEKIKCGNYSLTMMRLTKLSTKNNTVHLSKIFTDFNLTNDTPFIKLLLDSHDDAFYKVYEKSLLYEGGDKTTERHITKDRCKEWSDGYNIQTEYGYNYLHSGNVVLIKTYNVEKDIYGTLIIHFDGNIECIIEHNDRELRDDDIIHIIHDCNVILSGINLKQFYAFEPLDTLDEDITNVHSETQVDFLNSGMMFRKEDFQDKRKKIFPQWGKALGTFIQNFPMFLRVKTFEETENDSQIIGRYNRVDNYANITTIQSAIAAYKVIFEDPEIIIQKLSKDYNKDIDFIRKEYETWEELMSMKEGLQRTTTVINEGGSEIKIWLNQKEDLLIELKNMKSFEEQRRVFVFIKTMMNLYLSYITDPKGGLKRRLFESVSEYMNIIFDEEGDEELLEIDGLLEDTETSIKDDDLEALLDGLDDDDNELEQLLDDDDDDEIDFDQLGGAMDSDGYFETKSYYLKRLKKYDKDLFVFRSRQDRAGILYGYPRLCGAVDDRPPIAVTDKELERIDNSYEEGSGRGSYSEAISVPRRDENIKYICPKYWDISRSLSIRPDAVNKKDVIPGKLPKGSNGRTRKSILERSAIYWTDANDVKYYFPDIREESKQLHPMGYGLPCCFNASKLLKGDPEKRRRNKEEAIAGEGYISNKDPVGEGKYAHLHPHLLKIFNQNEKTFAKKYGEGFLRKGVKQNDNDYIFNTSPFLQSYFKILEKRDKISEEMFIEIIEMKLTTNLDKFQKCPLIHQKFRKPIHKVTLDDKSFIKDVLDKEETKVSFPDKTIQRLKVEMKTGVLKSNETCYLYQLLLSLKNYLDFLKSDENRDDTYILPLLLLLDEINIVIFENIDDEIKIKVTSYTKSEKIGFIYKRENNYEPILYRYYDKVKKEITEEYLFTQNLLVNNHYEIIIQSIMSTILSHKPVSKIELYEKIIADTGDSVQKLLLDNYSNVSYLITKKGNILPIVPEPIPSDHNYEYIYSFLEIQDINVGMNVTFGPNSKLKGTITKEPFDKKGRERVSIRGADGKEYPGILCSVVCFVDENVCMQMLPRFKKAVEYLSSFKEHFTITSLIENEEGNISTIVLSNNTYLPVIDEDNIPSKYPRIKAESMFSVDKELYTLNNNDDERKLFINMKKYEDYITKLGTHHILSRIQESSETVVGFVKDDLYYRVGEKIHFTVVKANKEEEEEDEDEEEEDDFIEKIDKTDHMYSQFENNYSIDGTITEMKPKGNEKYPKMTEVTIEVQLIDQIAFVLSDPIMIDSHKKLRLYEILEPHIDGLFHILKEKDYQKYELDQFITLCNRKQQTCNYPCTETDTGCKLYVREKDSDGNLLVEKIKWTFIEKLIIFGIENTDKIIEEKVSVHELMNSANFHETFYTFSEFKNNILNDIFIKKSKYIMNTVENRIVQRRNIVMKKLDKIPYFIHKLFGTGSSVVFNLTKDNNDFLTLEKALNQASISIDVISLKKILIEELEATKNDSSFLKKYNQEYSDVSEVIQQVKDPSYRIQNPDIELIIQNLSEKNNNVGILLVSSKNSSQKKNNVYFYHTGLDIMDVETAPIIPLYHTYYEGEFILSNIVIEHIGELKYYTTIRDLYDSNVLHKKWIKI